MVRFVCEGVGRQRPSCLTRQLSISKAYPTRHWVHWIVAVAVGHHHLCRGDEQVELCNWLLRLAIGFVLS